MFSFNCRSYLGRDYHRIYNWPNNNDLIIIRPYADDVPDQVLSRVVENRIMPNVGVGVYMSAPLYYLSLSLPRLIQNNYQDISADFTFSDLKQYHQGIHEVMLSYEIEFIKRRYVSPRYF